ncbi:MULTISPECIES: anthranilate synthase component I family protein [Hyphomonas]|nr:anthranilate synthase component I family protein [Hyphomonas adhaerens]MBB40939.1 aminodeoxychorismate/anthranilate synthase component I [Hyphomonas sp.]
MLRLELPWTEPAELAPRLFGWPGFVWLDSASSGHGQGRYSYISANPISRFRWGDGDFAEEFGGAFRAWRNRFRASVIAGGAPFQGGAIGYMSYDAAKIWMRDFRSRHPDSADDTIEFALYDTVMAFDHFERRLTIYSAGLPGPDKAPDKALAQQRIRAFAEVVEHQDDQSKEIIESSTDWSLSSDQAKYVDHVAAVREAILDGEIYQANIASLWVRKAPSQTSAFHDYLELRKQTQAPFSAFGTFAGRTLSSLSPERLVSMTSEGNVRAEPIKGTARRSTDPERDRDIARALARSEKDRAENIMIVDLLRNDLSRVCQPESVIVSRLCDLEKLPNLHHLVSTIEGQLAPACDVLDLLGAVFPGGSVTGAPKLRAMEIIDALEPAARGAFCGSFGYLGFDDACDFNIMIRTIDHLPDGDRYWSGAGLTLLSDAEAEWAEVQLKAERILSLQSPVAAIQ